MSSPDALLPALLALWRSPEFQSVLRVFIWLCTINAGFWILAKVVGAFLDIFSELFWEDVWAVLATIYNVVLAVAFAAVMFASAIKDAPAKDLLWREMCGFVLLYIALGAAYMDLKTHDLDDAARPGYALGLLGYVVCAAFPRLVDHPELYAVIGMMKALANGWIGKALTIFMIVGIAWNLARRGMREMFYWVSPFLWWIGALRHPPIRVRRGRSRE
jgi:hypothetical protein